MSLKEGETAVYGYNPALFCLLSVLRPTIRRKLLSPGERFIEEKRRAVEEKLTEAAEKRKVLEDFY